MNEKSRVQVCVEIAGDKYFYKGYLKDENEDYIKIDDDREGMIRLYKQNIRWVKEITE